MEQIFILDQILQDKLLHYW